MPEIVTNVRELGRITKANGAWFVELFDHDDRLTPLDCFDASGTLKQGKRVLAAMASFDGRRIVLWGRDDDGAYVAYEEKP